MGFSMFDVYNAILAIFYTIFVNISKIVGS